MDSELPIVPGRGFTTHIATKDRLDFLAKNGYELQYIPDYQIDISAIKQLIESFIGSVEIPVGLVGPLHWRGDKGENEWVYCSPATLEGALIYSMNRGAKLLSKSGGVQTHFYHQKMVRAPLFILQNAELAFQLDAWIQTHYQEIKKMAESFTNHGKLLSIESSIEKNILQTRFYYSTGDASGQNLTTTCTWHALLYIEKSFNSLFPNGIKDFVIEGNGASDKKISQFAIQNGRGCKVSAECEISEELLYSILRVDADSLIRFYEPSLALAQKEGMLGYSINAANSIASIFASTGQDLACIHESATAFFKLKRTKKGILFSIDLPNLVIGTVGGGTHLLKQAEALKLMGCFGAGKVERFAQLIAGFTLGLEISTFGAIVSGEFAKAHEKLGRNKPKNWLLKSEITPSFIQSCLFTQPLQPIESVLFEDAFELENGIITQLSQKVSKKLQGYFIVKINQSDTCLLKIRPPSEEVIKGLHLLAVSIDAQLADLLLTHRNFTPFHNCHLKEIKVNEWLNQQQFPFAPKCFGKKTEDSRDLFLLLQEYIHPSETLLLNAENEIEKWTTASIHACLKAIRSFHTETMGTLTEDSAIPLQQDWKAAPFYEKLQALLLQKHENEKNGAKQLNEIERKCFSEMNIHSLASEFLEIKRPLTWVHNDFNPRNIMILTSGKVVIYDWELVMWDHPERDVMEFLSFVLNTETSLKTLNSYLSIYYKTSDEQSLSQNYAACRYALKSLILTRFSLYEVAGIVADYPFSLRVLKTALHLYRILK
jgi:hydroxymethylglutaryl-CoA reductase (NADPH)